MGNRSSVDKLAASVPRRVGIYCEIPQHVGADYPYWIPVVIKSVSDTTFHVRCLVEDIEQTLDRDTKEIAPAGTHIRWLRKVVPAIMNVQYRLHYAGGGVAPAHIVEINENGVRVEYQTEGERHLIELPWDADDLEVVKPEEIKEIQVNSGTASNVNSSGEGGA